MSPEIEAIITPGQFSTIGERGSLRIETEEGNDYYAR